MLTARVEVASRRRFGRIGDFACQQDLLTFEAGIRLGDGREKRLAVGVCRVAEQLDRRSEFCHLAHVHHADPVRNVADHAQVVRDEQIAQVEPLLQFEQQVEDLCAHRHIERRDRLVTDDELRVGRKGARHGDALPLPAAERVRIALQVAWIEAHQSHELLHAIDDIAASRATDGERLADDVQHAHARIQRGIGVLENHLHAGAQGTQRRLPHARDLLSVHYDLAAGRVFQPKNGAAQGCLAGSRFSDQCQRFATLNVDVHAVYRAHSTSFDPQDFTQHAHIVDEVGLQGAGLDNGHVGCQCRQSRGHGGHHRLLQQDLGLVFQHQVLVAPVAKNGLGRQLERDRFRGPADFLGAVAARCEFAAGRQIAQAGHAAGDRDQAGAPCGK